MAIECREIGALRSLLHGKPNGKRIRGRARDERLKRGPEIVRS